MRRADRHETSRRLRVLIRSERETRCRGPRCEDCNGQGRLWIRGNAQTCHGCGGSGESRRTGDAL